MKLQLFKSLRILLLLLAVAACSVTNKINRPANQSNYRIDSVMDSDSQKDTAFVHVIESYKSQLDGEMNAIISVSDEEMIVGKPESKLSDYIADAMLAIGKEFCVENQLSHSVDLAIMNQGGIRTGMPKGEITTGRMFEMLPFKNKLVIVGMKGYDLMKLLHQVAGFNGEGISGVKMGIKDKQAVDVLVNGTSVDLGKTYHIISIDYLVNGGGGLSAFESRETFRHLHKKLRSEMIKYISRDYKNGKHISAELDGRIYHVE
ncbi:5'-nucleotidase [Labilibaculum sp. K2S]|uniref:5'-nucleotidase C-terminal domain-containing protein n=1 Tax=Labilibaculum sp. K2S TaxID=3056386 RepID=UPI0025A39A85|nr:5'-nucleotidase [Labilibaculum sp. K2S]MDM8161289.1 5'-nucleotidase [Labilibaculum sp. K2S]